MSRWWPSGYLTKEADQNEIDSGSSGWIKCILRSARALYIASMTTMQWTQAVVPTVESPPSRPFKRLLAQGTFYSTALQLSNVSAVLPFLCAQLGSLWIAALLYPLFSISIIAGYCSAPFLLGRARHLKNLVFAGGAVAMAIFIGCAALAVQHGVWINAVFLIISAALGITKGISDGAHTEVVSARLTISGRTKLILSEYSLSTVVVASATLFLLPAFVPREGNGMRVTLLWCATGCMLAAAVAALLVGPAGAQSRFPVSRIRVMFAQGMQATRSQHWFRRYVGTQLLLLPVSLGITFYSLHAAAQAGHGTGRISVLVVGSSLGLLIGSWLWRVVDRAAGVRGMLLGSSTLAVMAAVVCLVAVAFHSSSNVVVNGLVFLMAAAADQAVYTSSIAWVGMFAPEGDRAMLMGFGRALVAAAASVAGVVLGAMAHRPDAIWPIIVVLGLSVIALNAALRAPSRA
jgi:hypothetical protein